MHTSLQLLMHFCAFTNSDPTYVAYFSKNALQEENLNSSVQQFSICKRIQAVEQPFFFLVLMPKIWEVQLSCFDTQP